MLFAGLALIVRTDSQTGHSPPPWKNTAVRYIGEYPSAWGYALGRHGEPVWTNASLVGPEFDGRDVVVDPIAVRTQSTVSPAYPSSSPSSGAAVSSSSLAYPSTMSSMSSMSSAGIPQNRTLATNANVGSVPPSVPQQGVNLPFTMSSESPARRIDHQTAVHEPYSTLSAHSNPSYPAWPSNYLPPGYQHPPSRSSGVPAAAPAINPARSCVSGYPLPPATDPARLGSYVPSPANARAHPHSGSGYAPSGLAHSRVSGYASRPVTDPAGSRVSGAPPPATGPARPHASAAVPPPAPGSASSLVSNYEPPPATNLAHPLVSAPPPMIDPARQVMSNPAHQVMSNPARQVMSNPALPVPRAATQDLALNRTLPYNDYMSSHHPISSVPDAVDMSIDHASQWTHRVNMEMRQEKTRQLAISLETKKVDQNLESMKMQMEHHGQNTWEPVTQPVRHKGLSYSSLYDSSQAASSQSHPRGPSSASSSSSNRRRRSNASIASHPYHSTSSITSRSQHSNSSLTSLHFNRLIVKPSGNPSDFPTSGHQRYSGGDRASSGYVDGKGVKTWALANALGNDKTSDVADRSHPDRHEFANAAGRCGDVLSGSVSGTNGSVHTMDGHARTMHGGAVHEADGRAYVTSGSAETQEGRVHPTGGDGYMTSRFATATNGYVHDGRVTVTHGTVNDGLVPSTYGYANATDGHVQSTSEYVDRSSGRSHVNDGRIAVTDGSVSDGRIPQTFGHASATNEPVHYMTGGYDDATSRQYLEGSISDGNDRTIGDHDVAMSWMYENTDRTAVDANSVYTVGGGFPATNGV